MATRKLTNSQIDELCRAYQQGCAWATLRNLYDISDATIMAYLKLREVPYRRNYGQGALKLAPEEVSRLCTLYESGTPRQILCANYRISESTLSKYLRLNNVSFRGNWDLTEQEMIDLCADYENGMAWDDIWSKYHTGYAGMMKTLQEKGISYRGKRYAPQCQKKLSEDQMSELVQAYNTDVRPKELQTRYAISKSTLYGYLKTNVVEPRYFENPHYKFFQHIDTEQQAYWLGFIAADGCVQSSQGRLHVALARKDKDHLRMLNEAIGASNNICDYTGTSVKGAFPVSSLTICSKGLVRDLNAHGIVDRKTHLLVYPTILPALERHYLRGYFDGDGCWTVNKTGSIYFECIGRREFITTLQEQLVKACGLRFTKLGACSKSRVVATVRYGGNIQCLRIANYLYEGASVYMPRKRDIVVQHYQNHETSSGRLQFG